MLFGSKKHTPVGERQSDDTRQIDPVYEPGQHSTGALCVDHFVSYLHSLNRYRPRPRLDDASDREALVQHPRLRVPVERHGVRLPPQVAGQFDAPAVRAVRLGDLRLLASGLSGGDTGECGLAAPARPGEQHGVRHLVPTERGQHLHRGVLARHVGQLLRPVLLVQLQIAHSASSGSLTVTTGLPVAFAIRL